MIKRMIEKMLASGILFFVFTLSFAYAAPSIQILSPENTTYSNNKVLVNVSSDEVVDFYLKYNSFDIILANQTKGLETYLYVKEGSYNFTIYANNSNGTTNENIIFSVGSEPPPIQITSCGILLSPDTEYILVNNVSASRVCFYIDNKNITLDLNGYNINGGWWAAIYAACKNSKIFNGSITSEDSIALELFENSKCIIRDLKIQSGVGILVGLMYGGLFERIEADVTSEGIIFVEYPSNVIIRDSIFRGNPDAVFIREEWCFSNTIKIENTHIENFDYHMDLDNYNSDYYIRNTNLDTSKIVGGYGFTRIYIQHLVLINVTENGTGVAAKVDIIDNATLPRVSPDENEYILLSNPTSNISIATNDEGLAETWLTEKFILYTMFSPNTVNEYSFSPYNVTAKSKDTSQSQLISVAGNSTFKMNFNITFPKMPKCTISQMFDLNNDGSVNINDAVIMLRQITGLPVETGGPKNCEASHFFAQT